jgi:hypothetical protein
MAKADHVTKIQVPDADPPPVPVLNLTYYNDFNVIDHQPFAYDPTMTVSGLRMRVEVLLGFPKEKQRIRINGV